MIVPRHHTNWADLVRHLTKLHGRPVSWVFSNTYFFDDDLGLPRDKDDEVDIPDYLYMFKLIYRSARYNPLRHNMKSFNDPERVLVVREGFNSHLLHNGGLTLNAVLLDHLIYIKLLHNGAPFHPP